MARKESQSKSDEILLSIDEIVQLGRIGLMGRPQDVQMALQRLAQRHRRNHPELAAELTALLREGPTRSSPLRRESPRPIPLDTETRLELVRVESPDGNAEEPILSRTTLDELSQLAEEREKLDRLDDAGLLPSRSALFVGPPGVGKTMAARWLASRLNIPLLVLDLTAVMSSFLGRTGSNIRQVLDYAKSHNCLLLLDELDAVAKRRDDQSDVGELKRLVTVLLQEVDDWPARGSLLLAATNHPELLDPAIWRRFDATIRFELPGHDERRAFVKRVFDDQLSTDLAEALVLLFDGRSLSDMERDLRRVRRAAVLLDSSNETEIVRMSAQFTHQMSDDGRRQLAQRLAKAGTISQRQISALTGISRDTIRKDTRPAGS